MSAIPSIVLDCDDGRHAGTRHLHGTSPAARDGARGCVPRGSMHPFVWESCEHQGTRRSSSAAMRLPRLVPRAAAREAGLVLAREHAVRDGEPLSQATCMRRAPIVTSIVWIVSPRIKPPSATMASARHRARGAGLGSPIAGTAQRDRPAPRQGLRARRARLRSAIDDVMVVERPMRRWCASRTGDTSRTGSARGRRRMDRCSLVLLMGSEYLPLRPSPRGRESGAASEHAIRATERTRSRTSRCAASRPPDAGCTSRQARERIAAILAAMSTTSTINSLRDSLNAARARRATTKR